MKAVDFKGSNCVFAKDQREYLPLPACIKEGSKGEVVSCWSLSFVERLKVLLFGKLYLHVWTFNNPLQPQRIEVDNLIK